jgi:hypothetical protein
MLSEFMGMFGIKRFSVDIKRGRLEENIDVKKRGRKRGLAFLYREAKQPVLDAHHHHELPYHSLPAPFCVLGKSPHRWMTRVNVSVRLGESCLGARMSDHWTGRGLHGAGGGHDGAGCHVGV